MLRFRPTLTEVSRALAMALCALVAGCGGHGAYNGNNDDENPAGAPSAPLNLVANAGDQAISVGWNVPTTNASDPITYKVSISPAPNGSTTTVSGTTALIRGLNNNVSYTISVTASNTAGTSPAASTQSKPATVAIGDYTTLQPIVTTLGDHGSADPSLLRTTGGRIWMVYSDVEVSGSGPMLSSAVRLAHSDNNGTSYSFDTEVGSPTGLSSGTWNYRTPWLVEDDADPDANRRFKLFAQKFFIDLNKVSHFDQSALVMWTAASADGTWSNEEIVLGWTATPVALQAPRLLSQIDASLQQCQWVDEGSAAVDANGMELALSCALNTGLRQIVLLRSTDYAASFTYVSTLLTADDAVAFDSNSSFFSMPTLLPGGGAAPVLIVSPVDINGIPQGCVVFPFSDAKAGTLFEVDNAPFALQQLLPTGLADNGGCAWDRGIANGGILMNNRTGSTLTILKTGKSL